jgi:hypothetical protein
MKTLKILFALCIVFCYVTNVVNAQVIHVRSDGSGIDVSFTVPCINEVLYGEMSFDSRWLYGPNFDDSWQPVGPGAKYADFKVHNKEEYTLEGTDGKEYALHLQWIERRNVNNKNITYNMSTSWQIRCEGKVIGVLHWDWHVTLPANCEPGDFSAITDHYQLNCF